MHKIINFPTFSDQRGNLTVIEKNIHFDIKRIFYIYGVDSSVRGGHRHKKTIQAAICIKGSCRVYVNDGHQEAYVTLNHPNQCIILEPEDWHTMDNFTPDAILLVLASELFNPEDYIYEKY